MPVEEICSRASVIEVIHGETVVDPYRWLEDRSLPETDHWLREQRRRCEEYFANCPDLESIRTRVRSYLDTEIIDQPSRVGDQYFYRRRNRGEEQSRIYVRNIATRDERLLADPSAAGAFTSVLIYRISDDGSIMAYERRQGGEDKTAVAFVDVMNCRQLDCKLDSGYARGLVLRPEQGGFYYCHEVPTKEEEHTVIFREFGEREDGRVVFRAPRGQDSRLILTADQAHLGVIWLHQGPSGSVLDFFMAPFAQEPQWVTVFSNKGPSFRPFLHKGRIFAQYVTEDGDHCLSEFSSEGKTIRAIVSCGGLPIRQITIAGDRICANQFDHTESRVSCWSLDGEWMGAVDIPEDGKITLLTHQGSNTQSLFYAFESFYQPQIIFEYDFASRRSHCFHFPSMGDQSSTPSVTHMSARAKDGTEIPLTLVRLETIASLSNSPVILSVYGGWGAPMTPHFSVLSKLLMEMGAVLVLAHIRGGGEFGERWHEAGSKRNRQTGIDDLLSVADHLCSLGITKPERLGAFGGSNGGLMLAAALTQRPASFGALVCMVPLLDMVRYECFDRAARWRIEYGTIADPEDFRVLYAYSPYHRVQEGVNYPPVLFVAGDRDDRCNPAHVRKMAARLQGRNAQASPVIVDYSSERGHMPTLPLSARVEALARRIAFLARELKLAQSEGDSHEAICH